MMLVLYFFSGVNGKEQRSLDVFASEPIAPRGQLVFSVSLGALIFVPVFRSLTGLPPYIGMLLGLGIFLVPLYMTSYIYLAYQLC